MRGIVWNQLDQMSWTDIYTLSARFTFFLIYNCNAIYNINRTEFTDCLAGTISCTAICTALWPVIWAVLCKNTGLWSNIVIDILCLLTVTCAFDKGYILSACCILYAECCTDCLCNGCTSNRTCRWRHLTLCNGCCKTITAGISTSTTVISGKKLPHHNSLFIYRNFKLFTSYTEQNTNNDTNACYNSNSDQNCCNIHNDPSLYQSGKAKERYCHQT